MVILPSGWVQWDPDLVTFRGLVGETIYGTYGAQFPTVASWALASGTVLTEEQESDLKAEQAAWAATQPQPSAASTIMSKDDFLRLFQLTEIATILTASKENALVEAWVFRFQMAQVVNRADPDTVAGIEMLYSAGIISQETRNKVLG